MGMLQFLINAHLEAVQCRLKLVPVVVPLAMDVSAWHQLGTKKGGTDHTPTKILLYTSMYMYRSLQSLCNTRSLYGKNCNFHPRATSKA